MFWQEDVYVNDFRPVALKEFIIKRTELFHVSNSKLRNKKSILAHLRYIPFSPSDVNNFDQHQLSILVTEVVPQHSCLIFCCMFERNPN